MKHWEYTPDTEDKHGWCELGSKAEEAFVQTRLHKLGLSGGINVDKIKNPFVYDLTLILQADLKTVRTPLFMAQELYGLDPQYAVTFNVKDGIRYKELYPNILVLFDVRWDTLEWHGKTVQPMHRTFGGFLPNIRKAIQDCGTKRIQYKNRVDDTQGNAKESFVFDVRMLSEFKAGS